MTLNDAMNLRSFQVAMEYHDKTGCTYDGQSYSVHLLGVLRVAVRHSKLLNSIEYDDALDICALHDVIEDCRVSYNDLSKRFNKQVAENVYLVSCEKGRDRKERNSKTYVNIKGHKLATFAKLCDRIANTTYSFYTGSAMYKKYQSEFSDFMVALRTNNELDPLWTELIAVSSLIP